MKSQRRLVRPIDETAPIEPSDFVMSSLQPTGDSFDLSPFVANPWGFYVKRDGTMLFVTDKNNKEIHSFTFGTPFVLSTLGNHVLKYIGAPSFADLSFNPAGTIMIIANHNPYHFETFSLATAWDVSTLNAQAIATFTHSIPGTGFWVHPNGIDIFLASTSNIEVRHFRLNSAYNLDSGVQTVAVESMTELTNNLRGIYFSQDGTRMVLCRANSVYNSYTLSTPFDITTRTYDNDFLNASSKLNNGWDCDFVDLASIFYGLGVVNKVIVAYQ